jgi:hypothetical protein
VRIAINQYARQHLKQPPPRKLSACHLGLHFVAIETDENRDEANIGDAISSLMESSCP